jgi:hypothetical protein
MGAQWNEIQNYQAFSHFLAVSRLLGMIDRHLRLEQRNRATVINSKD